MAFGLLALAPLAFTSRVPRLVLRRARRARRDRAAGAVERAGAPREPRRRRCSPAPAVAAAARAGASARWCWSRRCWASPPISDALPLPRRSSASSTSRRRSSRCCSSASSLAFMLLAVPVRPARRPRRPRPRLRRRLRAAARASTRRCWCRGSGYLGARPRARSWSAPPTRRPTACSPRSASALLARGGCAAAASPCSTTATNLSRCSWPRSAFGALWTWAGLDDGGPGVRGIALAAAIVVTARGAALRPRGGSAGCVAARAPSPALVARLRRSVAVGAVVRRAVARASGARRRPQRSARAGASRTSSSARSTKRRRRPLIWASSRSTEASPPGPDPPRDRAALRPRLRGGRGRASASRAAGRSPGAYEAQILGPDGKRAAQGRRSTGVPSRARVSPDGRYGATTTLRHRRLLREARRVLDPDAASST